MKLPDHLRLGLPLICLIFAVGTPLTQTGCQSAPSERVVAARTLGVLGTTAKAGMDTAARLLRDGKITVLQFQRVALYFDNRWQPAYNFAVATVKSDLSSIASPDLQKLADEFATLVGQL